MLWRGWSDYLHILIFQEKTDKEQIELEEKEDEDKDAKKKKKEKKPKEKKPKEPKGPTKIDIMTTHLDLKERDDKNINTEIDVSWAGNSKAILAPYADGYPLFRVVPFPWNKAHPLLLAGYLGTAEGRGIEKPLLIVSGVQFGTAARCALRETRH